MKQYIFLIVFLLFSYGNNKNQKKPYQPLINQGNYQTSTAYGYVIGDIDSIEGVGFSHDLPGLSGKLKRVVDIPNFGHIKQIFLRQKAPRIPIVDANPPGEEYYKKIIPNLASDFFSPEMRKTYPQLCVLDMRPRTLEYVTQLDMGLQVAGALEKWTRDNYGACFRFQRSERDGLPVYTVVAECGTDFYGSYREYIKLFKSNILPGIEQFHADAADYVCCKNFQGKRFMLYAGNQHVYYLWKNRHVNNVYLAIDSPNLETVAKISAYMDWVKDLKL